MRRSYIASAIAGALVLGLATATVAATKGEFNNMCAESLSMGKDTPHGLLGQCDDQGQDLLLRQ